MQLSELTAPHPARGTARGRAPVTVTRTDGEAFTVFSNNGRRVKYSLHSQRFSGGFKHRRTLVEIRNAIKAA